MTGVQNLRDGRTLPNFSSYDHFKTDETKGKLEGGRGGEGKGGEGRGGEVGEGRGGEGRGGEGMDDGYTYCNRYVH